jgi:protein PhnA
MSVLPPCPQRKSEFTHDHNDLLVDSDHDIDCRIDGIGAMQLKSGFIKKAS